MSSRGNGGAIQSNEWAGGAGTAFVQRAGDEFFAGAGFAENANSGFAGGHAIHLGHDFPHGRAGPDDFMFAELLAQFSIFGFEMLQFEDVLHGEQQLFRGDRLFQEVERA